MAVRVLSSGEPALDHIGDQTYLTCRSDTRCLCPDGCIVYRFHDIAFAHGF